MYEVFEIIKRFLNNFTVTEEHKQKEIFNNEYIILLDKIMKAKTIAQLFNTHKEIMDFTAAVQKIGSPAWAKNRIKFLEAHWKRQYRLWKLRG